MHRQPAAVLPGLPLVARAAAVVEIIVAFKPGPPTIVITDDPSPLIFFADLTDGALILIALSLVISSSVSVTAGRPSSLWVSRVGGARRTGANDKTKPRRPGTKGLRWLPR